MWHLWLDSVAVNSQYEVQRVVPASDTENIIIIRMKKQNTPIRQKTKTTWYMLKKKEHTGTQEDQKVQKTWSG